MNEFEHVPLTPDEVKKQWIASIPPVIFDAINKLLVQKWKGETNSITILQDEILDLVSINFSRKEIFDNHWLDIEPFYHEAGWDVKYRKPTFNENFDAYFTFNPKPKYD